MAVAAPIRKRWQLEKLGNYDDPGWTEALQLQLNPPLLFQKKIVLIGDTNLLPLNSFFII